MRTVLQAIRMKSTDPLCTRLFAKDFKAQGALPISESCDRLDEPLPFDAGIAVQMLFEKTDQTLVAMQIKNTPI